jgi:hypothetical protein
MTSPNSRQPPIERRFVAYPANKRGTNPRVANHPAIDATPASLRGAQGPTAGGQAPTDAETPTTPAEVADQPISFDEAPGDETGQNPGGAPGNPPSSPQAPNGPSAPSAPAPVITSFQTPENIDCHNGDFQTFSASWTTTNATKTMISIDGPGGYKTYGPNDSDSLPFSCSSAHTFLLTAYGHDGSTVTRSITLQPRNVQAPSTDEDLDTQDGPAPAPAPAPAPVPEDEI